MAAAERERGLEAARRRAGTKHTFRTTLHGHAALRLPIASIPTSTYLCRIAQSGRLVGVVAAASVLVSVLDLEILSHHIMVMDVSGVQVDRGMCLAFCIILEKHRLGVI